MTAKDAAYRRFIREHDSPESATLRDAFNEGWHAALEAVQEQYEDTKDLTNDR